MKKKKLTDEQVYQLLEASNLPFQKIEHFARFLETASEERIFKYFANYNAYDEQELYFVQNAPADMIVRYFESTGRSICEFGVESQLATIHRGDHRIIMAMLRNRYNFGHCPDRDVEIIRRENEQEIDEIIRCGNFSEKGMIELLKYDRKHKKNKIDRFLLGKFDKLPNKVEIALAKSGNYEQIKAYLVKRSADSYGFNLQNEFLKELLKRKDLFRQLLEGAPQVKLCKISMSKYASHQQMMSWLQKKPDLGLDCYREFCHAMIARRSLDELLLLRDHFFQSYLCDSDVQTVLDMENKTLASWLVEDSARVKLCENHISTLLKRGWVDIVCQGCKSGSINSSSDLFTALIEFGDDETFAKVLKSTNFCLNGSIKAALSLVVSAGNPKWIEMCIKKFELKKEFKF